MKKIAFVALLSACIATPALADNTGKFYGAVDLGSVSFSSNVTGGANGTTPYPKPSAFRFAGGYNITPMFAVEAGYVMIGDSIIDSVGLGKETIKSSALSVAGVANIAINNEFGVFGKLGFANTKMDVTCVLTNGVSCGTANGSKTNLTFGLGGQYNINKQFAIRAQYEDFGKVTPTGANSAAGITMLSIGGIYNF